MKKRFNYKGVMVNAFGLPIISHGEETKKTSAIKRKYSDYEHFIFNFPLNTPKDLIIICNIPCSQRSERDWLRYQLKRLNYSMLQKNIWVGPYPLPKEFIDYLKSIHLFNRLTFLQLAIPYSRKL